MGGGMHQAIFAEEDILKSSIQLPLLRCHAQQVDFWLFTDAPPHSNPAVTNVAERKILQEHNSMFHSAVPSQELGFPESPSSYGSRRNLATRGTCMGCGRPRWSSSYHFQKLVMIRYDNRQAQTCPMGPHSFLTLLGPTPTCPWHALSPDLPQGLGYRHRGTDTSSTLAPMAPTAHGGQRQSVRLGMSWLEKNMKFKVMKTQRKPIL